MGDDQQKRRKFLKLLGISALSLCFGCHGARYFSLKKDCDTHKKNPKRIRIMSFNIANVRGNNDDFFGFQSVEKIKHNLDWIVSAIRNYDIDVVCLNEVDFNSARTDNIDMARYIADNTCFNHVINEKMFSLPAFLEIGNAVISRYPLKINTHHQYGKDLFAGAKNMFKSFLDFDVLLNDDKTKLNIVLTHLHNSEEEIRCEQTRILRNHLEAKKNPFVLLGDLNSTPDGKCFQHIIRDDFVSNPYLGSLTYPSVMPRAEIDYILVSSGLSITDYHTIPTKVSDHLPVIGDIIIE